MSGRFDAVEIELMWNRLQAIVDEGDAVLARTAFSTVVREAHDYVTMLLDAQGRALAQCTYSIPSFIGTLPITARHLLRRFPAAQLAPGDVLITNDPWTGTGHLPDISMIAPVFREGQVVALVGSIAHMTDIGGGGMSARARTIFEEGLRLPGLKLVAEGEVFQPFMDIIRANVRVPEQVTGDIEAQLSALRVMGASLSDFMTEYRLADLDDLGAEIMRRSEDAMRRAIREIPDGTYGHTSYADGFDEELTVVTTITIDGDALTVDYAGSSPEQPAGLNSVMSYTNAFTAYALKCVLDPSVPNNHGSFLPFDIKAPLGSFLNTREPAAVAARNLSGHLLPNAVFAALADVIPDRVIAECGCAPLWAISFNGRDDTGHTYSTVTFLSGGVGGGVGRDGQAALHFPTNAANTPIELLEFTTPVIVEEKRLRHGSGGAGAFSGGAGQRFSLRVVGNSPIEVALVTDKLQHAPEGLRGGEPGLCGSVEVVPARPFHPKGQLELRPGDRLILETPGGAGYGVAGTGAGRE